MTHYMKFFTLSLKRALKTWSLSLGAILLGLLLFIVHHWLPADQAWTEVYILDEDQSQTSRTYLKSLQTEEGFIFTEISDKEAGKQAVYKGETPAFIVIHPGMETWTPEAKEKLMTLYGPKENPIGQMISEALFAHYFDLSGQTLLVNYMRNLDMTFDSNRIIELDETYLQGDQVFQLEFQWPDGRPVQTPGFIPNPMAALIAIAYFFAMLLIQLFVLKDIRQGVYGSFPLAKHTVYSSLQSLAFVLPYSLSVFIVMAITLTPSLTTWLVMAIGAFSLWLFAYTLARIIQKPQAILSFIPIYLLGSLATSPSLFDWESLNPAMTFIPYLFPPSCFQWALGQKFLPCLVQALALSLISMILLWRLGEKNKNTN